MKSILLQYPDATPMANIVEHLTELSRGIGNKGQRPTVSFDDASLPGLRTKLAKRAVPLNTLVFATLAANQAVVTAATPIAITGGSVTFTVANRAITGGAFA